MTPEEEFQLLRSKVVKILETKQTDLHRFLNTAASQELDVCRLLMGWAIAAIGGLVIHVFLVVKNPTPHELQHLPDFKVALILFAVSTASGYFHHLCIVKHQRNLAKRLEDEILDSTNQLLQAPNPLEIFRKIIEKERKEATESKIFCITDHFLNFQVLIFLCAVILVTKSIFK